MDTAMRDLDQIEEMDPQDQSSRRLSTLMLAAVVTIATVFAMGTLVEGTSATESDAADPLATLEQIDGLTPSPMATALPRIDVDQQALTFPEALVHEERPDIAAVVAAAAAEYDHPDPIYPTAARRAIEVPTPETSPSSPATVPPASTTQVLSQRVAQVLPAGTTAHDTNDVLARSLVRDPLVAESIPIDASPRRRVAAGMEGAYTLQVISYRTPEEAQDFSETLREKGHAAFVVTATIPERGMHWRVRIGPFESQREADTYRRDFERTEQMNTYVVRRRD